MLVYDLKFNKTKEKNPPKSIFDHTIGIYRIERMRSFILFLFEILVTIDKKRCQPFLNGQKRRLLKSAFLNCTSTS